MKENFWSELPRPFFILAPMEDVTDIVFRHVVSEAARPDVFFTEFTNTESFCHPEGIHSVRGRLTFSEDEHPMVAHIWGDKPEQFRETSIQLAKMGFKGIDLNMGCPVANVAKKGKGSGLILRPDVAAEIIQATKAGGLPVSVKTRLGYYEIDEWKDWLKHVFEQDIANLSIHLRTRKEMSKVDAHWELIEAIKNLRDEIAPNTLLTINDDIPDRKTGLELAEKYSIDGVMIGRGIFHNPFAFEKEPREHTSKELLDLLRLHLSLFNKYEKDEIRQFKSLRRFFKIYVRGIRGASELRHQLMNTQSIAEARALLDEFEAQMDEDIKIEL
ncbi:tRNA dihydrouridine synthase [Staphylococcus aureus]|uniref:tRNA dihydrouridine synthase n=1 Tax=Staphylococcus aureus TaxID=1280 RepID=UPI00085C0C9B|nr:tRNA-dihydrouridine synthase [Staphylococcus aureus]SCS93183.1 tRNA dihydrouridine synthase B [Staphylococcus aureus]SCT33646.1 tRNA dihydrouridine synthase B [Staphylococcus aureus]SCT61888.1 tRNA dihydrouridine synthase B [Staphylococcus aureus]